MWIGLIMMGTMKEGILGGLLQKKIIKIKELLCLFITKAKIMRLSTLSENIAKYLLTMLANSISKDTLRNISPQKNVDVYDLIDVEKTNRFMGFNGIVYHNCLGVSYGMQSKALSRKLSQDMGEEITEQQAQKFIDDFYKAYPEFKQWNDDNLEKYYHQKMPLVTPDGWFMSCDNLNPKSVNNFPIQGAGATIMRKAVEYAQKENLKLIYTLHDALYIEFKADKFYKVDKLYDCMKRAFIDVWPHEWQREWAADIRQDIDVWSPEYVDMQGEGKTTYGRPMKIQSVYIDERSKTDYERFSKYFN